MKARHAILLFPLLALYGLLAAPSAYAQPDLQLRLLKGNTPQYYYYQLYFATYCGDSVIYDIDKSQLILEERHGLIDTNDYIIDRYASPDRNSCYDLAMVFDNSGAVTTDLLTASAAAGRALIDTMPLPCQRAALITYDDRPTLRTFLTDDRELLRSKLDDMTTGGGRALYDAINSGIIELLTNGRESLRILLVFAAGDDNASSTPVKNIVEEAAYQGIRIFVAGGSAVTRHGDLKDMCEQTGGLYYPNVGAAELPGFYASLAGFFQREFDEHRLTRRTKDPDMFNMYIRMRLEACDDSVWSERVFNPRNPTNVVPPAAPVLFSLDQSWPNPVSASASQLHLRFRVHDHAQYLRLQLFDGLGRLVATITDGSYLPGEHTVTWQPRSLRPGVYHYRLTGGAQVCTGSMSVLP